MSVQRRRDQPQNNKRIQPHQITTPGHSFPNPIYSIAGLQQGKFFFLVLIQFKQELVNIKAVIAPWEDQTAGSHKPLPVLSSTTYKTETEVNEPNFRSEINSKVLFSFYIPSAKCNSLTNSSFPCVPKTAWCRIRNQAESESRFLRMGHLLTISSAFEGSYWGQKDPATRLNSTGSYSQWVTENHNWNFQFGWNISSELQHLTGLVYLHCCLLPAWPLACIVSSMALPFYGLHQNFEDSTAH